MAKKKYHETTSITTLSALKKGELFRLMRAGQPTKRVYRFDGGKKVFRYTAFDDDAAEYSTKTNRQVQVGFTY